MHEQNNYLSIRKCSFELQYRIACNTLSSHIAKFISQGFDMYFVEPCTILFNARMSYRFLYGLFCIHACSAYYRVPFTDWYRSKLAVSVLYVLFMWCRIFGPAKWPGHTAFSVAQFFCRHKSRALGLSKLPGDWCLACALGSSRLLGGWWLLYKLYRFVCTYCSHTAFSLKPQTALFIFVCFKSF